MVPVLPLVDVEDCKDLNDLSISPYLSTEFDNLVDDLYDQDNGDEKGYGLVTVPFFPYFSAQELLNAGARQINFPVDPSVFAVLHNHPVGSYEMFFAGDVRGLYQLADNYDPGLPPGKEERPVTVFMTVRSYTYAIKVADINKLSKIEDIYVNTEKKEEFIQDFKNIYLNIDNIPSQASQNDLAMAFLNLIGKYDLGISLYRASNNDIGYDPQAPQQDSNWENLSLDNNGDLKFTNCN